MSWFSPNHYSQKEYYLPVQQIEKIVSYINIQTLNEPETVLVRNELSKKRGYDGQISLYQIYEVLGDLKNKNKISRYDLKSLMTGFEKYFSEKYK